MAPSLVSSHTGPARMHLVELLTSRSLGGSVGSSLRATRASLRSIATRTEYLVKRKGSAGRLMYRAIVSSQLEVPPVVQRSVDGCDV